jgi:hypothetical protein
MTIKVHLDSTSIADLAGLRRRLMQTSYEEIDYPDF